MSFNVSLFGLDLYFVFCRMTLNFLLSVLNETEVLYVNSGTLVLTSDGVNEGIEWMVKCVIRNIHRPPRQKDIT